ncbi:group II intron reverse transcriptase/maturase [Bacillus cereus]|uniref:group II intron reverse transcriptase/maturase n=1 Tax=Bacillus cereus TaxID=1396 RepID=UPI000BEBC58D|nr:group II intron reverse transcriptase/maturase [Bacillus cereus]PEA02023.1 group II intron reverse transcriptase/maturase [Bacillus cereus]
MTQKLRLLDTEIQLKQTFDELYFKASCEKPKIKDLYEIICSKANILYAIRAMKSNKGSKTAGVDSLTINDILQADEEKVIHLITNTIRDYTPSMVRRVWIPKAGKKELRPLGIPTILDRIIQQCVKQVIEPICEAQFFPYSFGFRPYRDGHMAIERVGSLIHKTKYHWVVEGDIRKFFDKVNHNILLKNCFKIGIQDKRVLMLIKAMLKAGVMHENTKTTLGTPQGGIISPILANIYLHDFDMWVYNQWQNKKTRKDYANKHSRTTTLKRTTKLKQGYLIRYADDWVIVTNSKTNAIKWKKAVSHYLKDKLKLELSEEKTKITNVRKKNIEFLGFKLFVKYKGVKGKKTKRYIPYRIPNEKRIEDKVKELKKHLRIIKRLSNKKKLIHEINVYNTKIRGLINYYSYATLVNITFSRFSHRLRKAEWYALKKHGGKWFKMNECDNIKQWYPNRTEGTPTIEYNESKIGIWKLNLATWDSSKCIQKNQNETPYTSQGRGLIFKRRNKRSTLSRLDEITSLNLSEKISQGLTGEKYNFEYFMNRASAFNRDKGQCNVTKVPLSKENLHVHHKNPRLPINEINKVHNLVCVSKEIHQLIHNNEPLNQISWLNKKQIAKVERYRRQLIIINSNN